jgi:hypothetical protein
VPASRSKAIQAFERARGAIRTPMSVIACGVFPSDQVHVDRYIEALYYDLRPLSEGRQNCCRASPRYFTRWVWKLRWQPTAAERTRAISGLLRIWANSGSMSIAG